MNFFRTCKFGLLRSRSGKHSENREPTGDRSLNDPYPEVEISACRTSNITDSDPEETSHKHPYFFWLVIVQSQPHMLMLLLSLFYLFS